MRWFKHYNDASRSDSLSSLIEETGLEGYGRYWLLLEFLAKKWKEGDPKFTVGRGELRRLLRLRSWNDLRTFVVRTSYVAGLIINQSGNDYVIEAPILLELMAKDFRKCAPSADKDAGSTAPKIKDKREEINIYQPTNYNAPFTEDGFYEKVKQAWNDNRGRLPECVNIDNKRKALIREVRQDFPNIADWVRAVKFLANDSFYNGSDGKNFKTNLTFLLTKGKLLEIVEKSGTMGQNDDSPWETDAFSYDQEAVKLEQRELGIE